MEFRYTLLALALCFSAISVRAQDEEYLKRWTPGGDTNAHDLPYPHRFAPYEREDDSDWRDDRWQRTDKGPFITHSFLLPGYELGPKTMAVQAGLDKHLLYDLRSGSFVAGVTKGEVRIDPTRFGLMNSPQLQGDVLFYVPAKELWNTVTDRGSERIISPIDASKANFRGLHLNGDRVLLVNQINGIEVLESVVPNSDSERVTRELEIAPRDFGLRLTLAKNAQRPSADTNGRFVKWFDKTGQPRQLVLDTASQGVRLLVGNGAVSIEFSKSSATAFARVSYAKGLLPKAGPAVTAEGLGLAKLKQPGPRHWGEPLKSKGIIAEKSDAPFAIDRITVPFENPFNALFYIAGLGFFSDGDAAVCTAHGDVWIVRGLDEQLKNITWQRFATGMYQPLGLEIVDEKVYVLGRDQITRLHDQNNDGEADYYESFNHDLLDQGQRHAFAMRLDREPDGSFLFLKAGEPPHGSALLRVTPDGKDIGVLARGFRHPFGMGVGPSGEITVADNEGNWVPSSKIDLIVPNGFYGFLGSATEPGNSPRPALPLCYIPKVADNASGGQFWNTSPKWSSYHLNEMFHFSWGRCTMLAVLRQQVGNTQQAVTVQIPGLEFDSGPAEAAFHPLDGQLYVVGLDGWQTAAKSDGSFERVRCTGNPVRLPTRFAAHADGIEVEFSVPLERESAENLANYNLEQWNYQWSGTYGSYHYSVNDPKRVGHDKVAVKEATLSSDGKKLFLKITDLKPVDQLQIAMNLRTADGSPIKCDLYATIHALDSPKPEGSALDLLDKENLVAWCIVPFDAKHRGPEERAVMLEELGVRQIAYDWREEHVPTFDDELTAYKRHGIKLHAFWAPIHSATPLSEPHWPVILNLLERHKVTPELWVMLDNSLLDSIDEKERHHRAAEILVPIARAAAKLNCKIGLYNHGGWFGDPDNQIRIIEELKAKNLDNVGIVYNFHHGHEHVAEFADLAKRMEPYLLTVNLNGMSKTGPQILPVGSGVSELTMLEALQNAGFRGPIGILGHRPELDARQSLQENLDGIEHLWKAK